MKKYAIGQQYELDLTKLKSELRRRKPNKVLLQIPEGLKHHLDELLKVLEKSSKKTTFITSMDPCFGACDLSDDQAKRLRCELMVHFGHTPIYHAGVSIIYVPAYAKISEEKTIRAIAQKAQELGTTNIGLVTTTQFVPYLSKLKKGLKAKGITVHTAKGSSRVKEEAQVLGCNYTAAHRLPDQVSQVVYLGDGFFHPVGLAINNHQKTIFAYNPLENQWYDFEEKKELFIKKRFAAIARAKQAKRFAILLSSKQGQLQLRMAQQAAQLLKKHHRSVIFLCTDLLKEEFLLGPTIDCYINTACPRITTDDETHFQKPLIGWKELQLALGERKNVDDLLDEIM